MKKRDFINIGCSANDGFARHLGVMLYSLLENCSCPTKVCIFLMDGGISKYNKSKLSFIVDKFGAKIKYLKPDLNLIEGLKECRHISIESYYRFSLFENLNVKKLLYLDGDMIVEGDIKELFETEFKDNIIFAVKDPGGSNKQKKLLGISKDKAYFSGGVLLVDCEKWRKQNITKKIIDYIKKNPEKIQFADQDGSNAILQDAWKELDPKWNMITRLVLYQKSFGVLPRINGYEQENIREIIRNPKIIHYAGFMKPWFFIDPLPRKKRYWHYLGKTPWKREKYDDKKIARILERSLVYQKMLFKEIVGR